MWKFTTAYRVAGAWGECSVHLTNPQPGVTPAASKIYLMTWLNPTIQSLTKYNVLVHAAGQRQWRFYHHMTLGEFLEITSVLSSALMQWENDCVAHGYSCGRLYYVGGSVCGSTQMSYQAGRGPFRS